MEMNLQFFAEDSVNTEGVAEPTTTTTEPVTEPIETTVDEPVNTSTADMTFQEIIDSQKQQVPEEPDVKPVEPTPVQTKDDNAKFAAARRESEARLKAQNEAFANRVKGMVNPKTGKQIETQEEYWQAIDDQKELETQLAAEQAKQQLQQSGVNMNLVNQMIQNSPEMQKFRQTQAQMEEFQRQRDQQVAEENLQSDLKELSKYDENIKTLEDVAQLDKAQEIVQSIQSGMSLDQAYRLAYFDKIVEQKSSQAKQGAINQVKAKSHLQTTRNITSGGADLHVPESVMNMLREMYESEGLSDAEIRKRAALHVNN